jgi:hypothetical protein
MRCTIQNIPITSCGTPLPSFLVGRKRQLQEEELRDFVVNMTDSK